MGHFRKFCAITHLPIACGERCIGIWTGDDEKNKMVDLYYEPYSFRSLYYRGTYDDYGRLEFDENQKYVDLISSEDIENGPDVFILESVFDAMNFAVCSNGDGIGDGSGWNSGYISSHSLEQLGFTKIKESYHDRYKHTYTHTSNSELLVLSDGKWIEIYDKTKNAITIKYCMGWRGFEKLFPDVDYSYLNNNTQEYITLSDGISEMGGDALFSLGDIVKDLINMTYTSWARNMGMSVDLLKLIFIDHEARKECGKIIRVRRFMQSMNIQFGHSFDGGPQDGNFEAVLKYKKLLNVAIKNSNYLKRYEPDDDDYIDEEHFEEVKTELTHVITYDGKGRKKKAEILLNLLSEPENIFQMKENLNKIIKESC